MDRVIFMCTKDKSYIVDAINIQRMNSMNMYKFCECVMLISYLTDIDHSDDAGQQHIDSIIQNESLIKRLINLLDHESAHIRHPALRTVGNVVIRDERAESVIKYGLLNKLSHLMEDQKLTIKREACWTISNITAHKKDQIESVISANLIPQLINILKTEPYEVSKEALWALVNATTDCT